MTEVDELRELVAKLKAERAADRERYLTAANETAKRHLAEREELDREGLARADRITAAFESRLSTLTTERDALRQVETNLSELCERFIQDKESLTTENAGLATALRQISEGNLGDYPWQADYARIREVARDALALSASRKGGDRG
jgi:hypothetical protein